ncbi:integrase, partial [Gammaproteobacteria bacterium]|nr:integrase [Gammaproteobacteria bacterium]
PFRLLPEFMTKLCATNSPESKLLAFTILTVSRPGEARVADWSEFDLENKLWTIPPVCPFLR